MISALRKGSYMFLGKISFVLFPTIRTSVIKPFLDLNPLLVSKISDFCFVLPCPVSSFSFFDFFRMEPLRFTGFLNQNVSVFQVVLFSFFGIFNAGFSFDLFQSFRVPLRKRSLPHFNLILMRFSISSLTRFFGFGVCGISSSLSFVEFFSVFGNPFFNFCLGALGALTHPIVFGFFTKIKLFHGLHFFARIALLFGVFFFFVLHGFSPLTNGIMPVLFSVFIVHFGNKFIKGFNVSKFNDPTEV